MDTQLSRLGRPATSGERNGNGMGDPTPPMITGRFDSQTADLSSPLPFMGGNREHAA